MPTACLEGRPKRSLDVLLSRARDRCTTRSATSPANRPDASRRAPRRCRRGSTRGTTGRRATPDRHRTATCHRTAAAGGRQKRPRGHCRPAALLGPEPPPPGYAGGVLSRLRHQLARLPAGYAEFDASTAEHRDVSAALRRQAPTRAHAAAERHARQIRVPLQRAAGLAHPPQPPRRRRPATASAYFAKRGTFETAGASRSPTSGADRLVMVAASVVALGHQVNRARDRRGSRWRGRRNRISQGSGRLHEGRGSDGLPGRSASNQSAPAGGWLITKLAAPGRAARPDESGGRHEL